MRVLRLARTRAAAGAGALLAALLGWWVLPAARAQGADGSERTVAVNGTERAYVVHVPPNVTRPAPVVLLFHGGGGRPEGIARKTGMNDIADKYNFIVVYPAGLGRRSGGRGTWNVGGADSPSSADDVAFVQAILHELDQTATIDHARVYATGLSMGGVFSYRLACEMADTFAAIAPVAATMVEPGCHPSSPVAVLHLHGAKDDRIPIEGGRGDKTAENRIWPAPQEGLSSWSQFDSCAGQPKVSDDGSQSCTTYAQCHADVEYCVIADGGHDWPNDASERIWAFFAAHPKQAH